MIEIIALGVLQGVAEFLPISSSGHLVLAQNLMGVNAPGMRLDIFLHVGTLVSICVFYWRVIWRIVSRVEWDYALKVIVSAVPAVVVGLGCKEFLDEAFESSLMVGCALIFTGCVLIVSRFMRRGQGEVTYWKALIMGIFQAIAITPGVSRSGMTLVAAHGAGVEAERSAEFSFLMSAPLIAGAAAMEVLKSLKAAGEAAATAPETSWGLCLLGAAVAGIVGYWALKFLLRSLKSQWFWLFGPYCLVAGAVALLLS